MKFVTECDTLIDEQDLENYLYRTYPEEMYEQELNDDPRYGTVEVFGRFKLNAGSALRKLDYDAFRSMYLDHLYNAVYDCQNGRWQDWFKDCIEEDDEDGDE